MSLRNNLEARSWYRPTTVLGRVGNRWRSSKTHSIVEVLGFEVLRLEVNYKSQSSGICQECEGSSSNAKE